MDGHQADEALQECYDVVVVGGGAAGLAGALPLARMRRSVLVVDAGSPRNAPAEGVHNYLGREGVPPRELAAAGRAEVERYGARVVDGRVASLRRSGGEALRFDVALADGRTTTARRLLLATGAVDALPPVPGLAELWGTGVVHCPFCHGWELRDAPVAVLSTGPMSAHAAGLWRQLTDDVVVLSHTGPPLADEQAALLAARGVRVVEGEVAAVGALAGGGVEVRLASGEVLERAAVAVASTVRVDEQLLGALGVAVDPVQVMGVEVGTAVRVDPTGATTAPGVWAAGNATTPMAVVATSAASGVMAGSALSGDLVREDGEAALAAAVMAP